jgi:hypothetical protein
MTTRVNSLEELEAYLKGLDSELPAGVYFLGSKLGEGRMSTCSDDPTEVPPNPIKNHPYSGVGGFSPLIVII